MTAESEHSYPPFENSVLSTPDGYVRIQRINRQGYPWVMLGVPLEDDRAAWAWADAETERCRQETP